jgi:hypothetical protein
MIRSSGRLKQRLPFANPIAALSSVVHDRPRIPRRVELTAPEGLELLAAANPT